MPYAHGPGGAKGIGELPMDGPAPAIANADRHATGVDVRRIPVTPELLAQLLGGGGACLTQTVRVSTSTVNGRAVEVEAHPMARLLDVLRDASCTSPAPRKAAAKASAAPARC